MDRRETLTETEGLLLMAAAVHALGPATDLSRANTARVVDQVLRWRGLSAEEVRDGWQEQECGPIHAQVYNALIRMTHEIARAGPGRPPERPGAAVRGWRQLGRSRGSELPGVLAAVQLVSSDSRGRAAGPRLIRAAPRISQGYGGRRCPGS